MEANRVNSWLTLAANVGVIIGMVLLIVELRQTNSALLGATYQARTQQVEDWDKFLAESEYVAPAILRYRETEFESLPERDQFALFQLALASFNRLDGLFYQYELGLLDDQYYTYMFRAEMEASVPRWRDAGLLDHPFYRSAVRPGFEKEIAKYTDAELWR